MGHTLAVDAAEDAWRIQVLQHRVESIRAALDSTVTDDVRAILMQHLDQAEAELRQAKDSVGVRGDERAEA